MKREAPKGCHWQPSTANARVLYLKRVADCHLIGSIEPKGKLWQNRDTGELFDTKDAAMGSVESWL